MLVFWLTEKFDGFSYPLFWKRKILQKMSILYLDIISVQIYYTIASYAIARAGDGTPFMPIVTEQGLY